MESIYGYITPPVAAKEYDGSHHPRYTECSLKQTRFDVGSESAELWRVFPICEHKHKIGPQLFHLVS